MADRVLGFVILHYGKPYLRYAIESVYDQVDKIVILYTDRPSQGFSADIPCPDTREELRECVEPFMDKIQWVDGHWSHEGEHTEAIWNYAEGYDWIWRLDADEVSPPGMVAEMIRQAKETNHKSYRIPFIHFWKCFHRVCRDGQQPVRLVRVDGGEGERNLDSKGGEWTVFHFGYAVPTKYIAYKMQVSGHRPEWRPDWFENIWLKNSQKNTHPVMHTNHWMPEDFDKTKMPDVIKRHPFYNAEVIE